jgi:hypothetical protein
MRRLLTCILAFSIALPPVVAQAQFMNYTPLERINICWQPRVYGSDDSSAPPPVASLLNAAGPGSVIRACTNENQELHLYLRVADLPQNDICRAREVELFPATVSEMVDIMPGVGPQLRLRGWRTDPPEHWKQLGYRAANTDLAMVAAGVCPQVGDRRYLLLADVPDAVLKDFDKFWRNATASPENFQAALGNVPFEFSFYMPWIRKGAPALLAEFRDIVFQGKITPRSLQCEAQTCTLSIGFMSRWIRFRITPDGLLPVSQGGFLIA